jgi:tRNA(Ile)-lysidine synthase
MRLLVAVSGGSDSVGLLIALKEHATGDLALMAATVDHGLRSQSADEARDVAVLCSRLGIPHTTLAWKGQKPSAGVAAAAREARYQLLCEAAEETGADAILTDARGLAGMAEIVLLRSRHWLLRPLLRTRRENIRNFLRQHGEVWIDDPSNSDQKNERARTRKALELQSPVSAAEIDGAGQRRQDLSQAAARLLAKHASFDRAALMHLLPHALNAETAILRYALWACAAVVGGRDQGPTPDALQRVMGLVAAGVPGRLTAGRVVFDLRRGGLFLCRESRDLPVLTVEPAATAAWDGRFRVINNSKVAVTVEPSRMGRQNAQAVFAHAPSSIAVRAARSMPAICATPGEERGVTVAPILAPFDRFLPQFDLQLARTVAELAGCDNFPPLPMMDYERKR